MDRVRKVSGTTVMVGALVAAAAVTLAAAERFAATATVKTAGGATVTAPISITVDRTTAPAEAEKLVKAFQAGGTAGLRKALAGLPPTGTIRLGAGADVTTVMTLERTTDQGRLLTMITDKPIAHLGAGLPDAKPKAGYDFAVLDLQLGAGGVVSGILAPAARITIKQGAFVVDDYSTESVRISPAAASR